MKLILHIGTEKTGTTSLQRWLHQNQKSFSDQGVFLSDVIGQSNNRALPFCFLTNADNLPGRNHVRINKYKQKHYPDFAQRFKAEVELANASHHTMIISSEHFHRELCATEELENLKAVLSVLFEEVSIVCYFREQASLRESRYSTALAQSEGCSIEDYDRHVTAEDPYYNCFKSASIWSDVFGRDRVDFRIYDRNSLVDRDIRFDFLTALPQKIDKASCLIETNFSNEGFSLLEARAFQTINQHVPFWNQEWEASRVNKLYKAIFRSCLTLKVGKIVDRGRAAFARQFDDSNAKFFTTFIKTKKGFDIAPPKDDQNLAFSLSDVGAMVQDIAERLIARLSNSILLKDDAELLRDIASKYASQEPITQEEALALLKLAARAA